MNQPANSIRTQAAMLSAPTPTQVLVASIDANLSRCRTHADRIEAELTRKDQVNA